MPIPVHIVSGFLGTGKTTAIRAQLEARPGERVAVIVNDFGAAGFDELVLASSGQPFEIRSIPGGCVCCTAPEGFAAALRAVVEQGPDRLWIEPTGLARPQDLIDAIRRGAQRERLELAPVVVLVDPGRIGRESPAERELVREQLEAADVVVANRTDLCSEAELERFDALARELWPPPLAVHRTRHGRLPESLLAWPAGEGARLPRAAAGQPAGAHAHGEAPSTAGYRARSWRWSPEAGFSRERLMRALLRAGEGLAGAPLARFKGVFRTREGTFQLELAGGTPHERPSAHRRDSRADAIFEAPDEKPLELLARWLEGALLAEAELRAEARQIEIARPDGRVHVVDRERLLALPFAIADVSALFPKRAGSAARLDALWSELDLPSAGFAVVCAADGFASEPVALEALRQGVLLHSLAGEPLGEAQGGPFRLLIPEGVPGAPSACANVKAVTRIVLRAPPATA
jgi:G3E family GTPase